MPPVFKVNISSETTQRETRLMMNGGRDEAISAQPLGEWEPCSPAGASRSRLHSQGKDSWGESLLSLGVYTLYTSCTPATRLLCNETIQLSLTSRYSDRSVHANSGLDPNGTGLGRHPGGTAANEVVVAATHTHTHTHSLTHTHTHIHSLSLSLSHTHSLSLSHTHPLSLSHTHTHTLSLSHTHTYSLSHAHIHTQNHTSPQLSIANGGTDLTSKSATPAKDGQANLDSESDWVRNWGTAVTECLGVGEAEKRERKALDT